MTRQDVPGVVVDSFAGDEGHGAVQLGKSAKSPGDVSEDAYRPCKPTHKGGKEECDKEDLHQLSGTKTT